ncbi:unnamed protein product [Darwinula stevensoni]|uniref:Uncharacterized protein n=1 Tax=Darwinula stevensoni TaxID=69355 RepID=A0A7R9AGL0_9CRUS|nr:unnamed protein product [Darwinula stevensoni]CAG0904011.1 unnamed protein product [Darwinula stevensoni]
MPGLVHLDLGENFLLDLPPVESPSLERLYLGGNEIARLTIGWSTPNLTALVVDNNPITEVEHGFFENLKKLWQFSCNNCNLGPTLFNGTLEFHSETLRYVSLGGNNISSLESHAITGFTAETRIELWGNEIRNFTKESFLLMLENLAAGEGYIDLYGHLTSIPRKSRLVKLHVLCNSSSSSTNQAACGDLRDIHDGGVGPSEKKTPSRRRPPDTRTPQRFRIQKKSWDLQSPKPSWIPLPIALLCLLAFLSSHSHHSPPLSSRQCLPVFPYTRSRIWLILVERRYKSEAELGVQQEQYSSEDRRFPTDSRIPMGHPLRYFLAGSCAIFAFGALLNVYRDRPARSSSVRPFLNVPDASIGPETEIFCGRRSISRGPNQKVLSYSLFGVEGASRAAGPYETLVSGILDGVRKWYPGWVVRIYTNYSSENEEVASWMKSLEEKFPIVDFCHVENLPGIVGDVQTRQSNGRVWRYLPMMDPLVDAFASRDSDSPVSSGEAAAVKEWVESEYLLHAMKDHPAHHGPVFAGLWGAKVSQNRSFVHYLGRKMVFESKTSDDEGLDQDLLRDVLWDEAREHFLVPASFTCDEFVGGETRPFPTRRDGGFWLGSGTRYAPLVKECPLKCRPKVHPDWVYC